MYLYVRLGGAYEYSKDFRDSRSTWLIKGHGVLYILAKVIRTKVLVNEYFVFKDQVKSYKSTFLWFDLIPPSLVWNGRAVLHPLKSKKV